MKRHFYPAIALLVLVPKIAVAQFNIGGFLTEAQKILEQAKSAAPAPVAQAPASVPGIKSEKESVVQNNRLNCNASKENTSDYQFELKKLKLGMTVNEVRCIYPELKEENPKGFSPNDPDKLNRYAKYDMYFYKCYEPYCGMTNEEPFEFMYVTFLNGKLISLIYFFNEEYDTIVKLIDALSLKFGKPTKMIRSGRNSLASWIKHNEIVGINGGRMALITSDYLKIDDEIKEKIADDKKREDENNRKNKIKGLAEQL